MRFFIKDQRAVNYSTAQLSDVIDFIKYNKFVFKNLNEFSTALNYGKMHPELDCKWNSGTIDIGPKTKKGDYGFITSIIGGNPIIDNGYSYVFIDLDIKKFPNKTKDEYEYITDIIFNNYSMEAQDDEDFRKGIIFVKKSSSNTGLHLLFRVKACYNKEQIKAYGIKIAKRYVDQCRTNIFSIGVFDTTSFSDNWKMNFNYLNPNDFWINPNQNDFLEDTEDELRKVINWYGKKGPRYNIPVGSKNISELWIIADGKNFEKVYKLGFNHNRMFSFIGLCKSYNIQLDEIIKYMETNHQDIIDSSDPYSDNETTRKKIERLWKHTSSLNGTGFVVNANTFFDGKNINKDVLYNKIKESNLRIIKGLDSIDRKRDLYIYSDGVYKHAEFNKVRAIVDTNWMKDFLNTNNINNLEDRAKIVTATEKIVYEIGEFDIIDRKDFKLDTYDQIHLYTNNGTIEIGKNKIDIIKSDYIESWLCRETTGNESVINYDPNLNLEDWPEMEFFRTCTDNFDLLKRTLGYLLQRKKSDNKTIMFVDGFNNDSTEDESGSGGGTGKTLCAYILKAFRNCLTLTTPDPTNRFWLDLLSNDTEILILNEVDYKFKMSSIRGFEDLQIQTEVKGSTRETVKMDMVPRILITTNYSILGSENPDIRRTICVPFNNRWRGVDMSKEFGHNWFRSQHDPEWWSYLMLFMIECIKSYMNNPNLKTGISDDMIQNKATNQKMIYDDNVVYYDIILMKLVNNKVVYTNNEIMDINKEHRVKINPKKVNDYIKSKIGSYIDLKSLQLDNFQDKTGDRRRGLKIVERNFGSIL